VALTSAARKAELLFSFKVAWSRSAWPDNAAGVLTPVLPACRLCAHAVLGGRARRRGFLANRDEVDPVRHQGREAIARPKAEPAVATGQRGARPVELAPPQRAVGRSDRDFVWGGIEADLQRVIQRRGRGFEPGTLEQHSLDPTRVPAPR